MTTENIKIPIVPDFNRKLVVPLGNNKNYIYDDKLFIKKLFAEETDAKVFERMTHLNLNGLLTPQEVYMYYSSFPFVLVVSNYLKNSTSFFESIKTMTPKEILITFKGLLNDLKKAHQVGLNPNDIKFTNYMVNAQGQVLFTDFDVSFFEGKPTMTWLNRPMFDLEYFNIDSKILSERNLNLNDKSLLLSMLLASLNKIFKAYTNPQMLKANLEELQRIYNLDKDTLKYLESVINKKQVPSQEDYFIDTLIDPLLDCDLKLKKEYKSE